MSKPKKSERTNSVRTKATLQVNNGKEFDLDSPSDVKDFQVELAKTLQLQEEKARAQGIGFHATLEKTSQDRDGERTVVLKVPRTDRIAIDLLSHWDSQPLNVVIAVAEHYKQDSFFSGDETESEDDE